MAFYDESYKLMFAALVSVTLLITWGCSENPLSVPENPNAVSKVPPDLRPADGTPVSGAINLVGRVQGDFEQLAGQELMNGELSHTDLERFEELQGIIRNCEGSGASKPIKRSWGGMLSHCGHSIFVPWEALPYDTEMSIYVEDQEHMEIEFGPDMWFDKKVSIIISYRHADMEGTSPQDLRIVWFDELTNQWLEVESYVDSNKQYVKADVWHFTRYALSRR